MTISVQFDETKKDEGEVRKKGDKNKNYVEKKGVKYLQ